MVTRVAWSPSPTKPRVSAVLEHSDWVALWTLPQARSLLRGGGGVFPSWDCPEDLCMWPLCGRVGFLTHAGKKTLRSEESPLLLLELTLMPLPKKEGEGQSATPPLEPIRSQDLEHRKFWRRVGALGPKCSSLGHLSYSAAGFRGRLGAAPRHFRIEPRFQPNSEPLRALPLVPDGWAGAWE